MICFTNRNLTRESIHQIPDTEAGVLFKDLLIVPQFLITLVRLPFGDRLLVQVSIAGIIRASGQKIALENFD